MDSLVFLSIQPPGLFLFASEIGGRDRNYSFYFLCLYNWSVCKAGIFSHEKNKRLVCLICMDCAVCPADLTAVCSVSVTSAGGVSLLSYCAAVVML